MKKYTYPFPGLYGWLATFGCVVGFDLWASLTDHPTMSNTLGYYERKGKLWAPILAGAWLGLTYHLLISELFPDTVDSLVC